MSEQKIGCIREAIQQAQLAERKTCAMSRYLRSQMQQLHPAIELPSDDPHQALVEFVTRYIEHVPEFLTAVSALLREAGIYEQGRHCVEIAEDFFLDPPELLAEHSGMQALIDEAYLAHRLMEEVNDRFLAVCGAPLTPMDMTLSNVLIHHLLGDEFADQLDLAVHYAIEALFPMESLIEDADFAQYLRTHKLRGWQEALRRWPCLAGDAAIGLRRVRNPAPTPILH